MGGRVSFLLGSRHTGDSLSSPSRGMGNTRGKGAARRRRKRRRKVARGANNPRGDSTNKTTDCLKIKSASKCKWSSATLLSLRLRIRCCENLKKEGYYYPREEE